MRALGIDVGVRKGLDLVLLNSERQVAFARRHVRVEDLPALLADLHPDAVAIDSPPWFGKGGPRATEVAVRKRGISLYATPWEAEKTNRRFYDWMRVGHQVFAAVAAAGYPLFGGSSFDHTAFEVFPYGAAVVLSSSLRPKERAKLEWRRSILERHMDTATLATVDQVDAGLAALTGVIALEGGACWSGLPSEGVIVLPCSETELLEEYRSPSP